MGCGAGFHSDQARRKILKKRQHPGASQLAAEDHASLHVNAMDLKDILRKIDITSLMGGSYFPVVDENYTLAHRDAVGWKPSTASKAVVPANMAGCLLSGGISSEAVIGNILEPEILPIEVPQRIVPYKRFRSRQF
jgi:hypothetical protein